VRRQSVALSSMRPLERFRRRAFAPCVEAGHCVMIDLLQRVLGAHGGLDRWNTFKKVSATIVADGELFAAKGINFGAAPQRVTAAIDHEWMTEAPYRNPDWRVTFVPERVVIESSNNSIVGERDNPRASFAGHKYAAAEGIEADHDGATGTVALAVELACRSPLPRLNEPAAKKTNRLDHR